MFVVGYMFHRQRNGTTVGILCVLPLCWLQIAHQKPISSERVSLHLASSLPTWLNPSWLRITSVGYTKPSGVRDSAGLDILQMLHMPGLT